MADTPDTGACETRPTATSNALFVGRTDELRLLQDALSKAKSGSGGLVLVSGEAGIGKTHLLNEAARYAERQCLPALWGRCNASDAPAFWPWLQVLRALPDTHKDALAQAISSILEPTEIGTATENHFTDLPWTAEYQSASRFRLFDSIAAVIERAAIKTPLAVFIDDLHDADSDSLALVEFIASSEHTRRNVALVASYRSEEMDSRPEFEQLILPLVRNCSPTRILLRGLEFPEAQRLVAQHCQTTPKPTAIKALHLRAGGNPFFIVETCKLNSAVATEDDYTEAPQPASTIRALARARLNRLSRNCRRHLEAAAVLGPEFETYRVGKIIESSGYSTNADWVDEAARFGVISNATIGDTRRFSHAILRDSIYHDVAVSVRKRLHRAAAETFQCQANCITEPAIDRLAHHSYLAEDFAERTTTIDHLIGAGRAALRGLAYQKAALHFERALSYSKDIGDLETQCDIRLLLGESQMKAGLWSAARPTFEEALTTARHLCCPERLAAAAIGLKGMTRGTLPPDRAAIRALREALAVIPPGQAALKAKLLTALSSANYFEPDKQVPEKLAADAVAAALNSGDPNIIGDAIEARAFSLFRYDRADEFLASAVDLENLGLQHDDPDLVFRGKIMKYTALGQKNAPTTQTELQLATQIADSLRHPRYMWQAMLAQASLALSQGNLERCETLCTEVDERGKRYHDPSSFQHLLMLRFTRAKLYADYSSVIPALEAVVSMAPEYPLPRAGLAFMQAASGAREQAEFTLAPIVSDGLSSIAPDGFNLGTLCILAETCAYLGKVTWLDELRDRLSPYETDSAFVGWGTSNDGSVAHFLSIIDVVAGNHQRARDLAELAVHVNQQSGYSLLAARSMRQLAYVLHLLGRHTEEKQVLNELSLNHEEPIRSVLGSSSGCSSSDNAPPSRLETSAAQARKEPAERKATENRIALRGEYWTLSHAGKKISVKDCRGLQHIDVLLRNRGVEFAAIELAGGATGTETAIEAERQTPLSDLAAIRAYRGRLSEISVELKEAEANSDIGRIEKLQREKGTLEEQLLKDTGLFGQSRSARDSAERARVNVRNAITTAIKRVSKSHRELARHLERSIKTGRFCKYDPDGRLTWTS